MIFLFIYFWQSQNQKPVILQKKVRFLEKWAFFIENIKMTFLYLFK